MLESVDPYMFYVEVYFATGNTSCHHKHSLSTKNLNKRSSFSPFNSIVACLNYSLFIYIFNSVFVKKKREINLLIWKFVVGFHVQHCRQQVWKQLKGYTTSHFPAYIHFRWYVCTQASKQNITDKKDSIVWTDKGTIKCNINSTMRYG